MKIFLIIFSFFCFRVEALKILGILSFGSHSHFTIGRGILQALHDANHEVTIICPFPERVQLEKSRVISTADTLERFKDGNFQISLNIY
jgi:hypothetical protein